MVMRHFRNDSILSMKFIIQFLLCAFLAISCSDEEPEIMPPGRTQEIFRAEDPENQGNRTLAIGVSEGRSGFPETFRLMQLAEVGSVELNLDWTYFEEKRGQYQDPQSLLTAVQLYADNNIKLGLSLATINTVRKTHPAYLNGISFDDPVYINAFTDLMNWILSQLPPSLDVYYISVGNEVDLFLDETEWPQFKSFLEESKKYFNEQYPDVPIGAKTTVTEGLFGESRNHVLDIINGSDVAMINYYPTESNFRVRDPSVAFKDFDRFVGDITIPIFVTEIGYHTGTEYALSSEAKQALFYHNVMQAWDRHIDRIELIQINWMHDVSENTLEEFQAYYGSQDPAFVEFLATLGLRTHNEVNKLAFDQLLVDLSDRNWTN